MILNFYLEKVSAKYIGSNDYCIISHCQDILFNLIVALQELKRWALKISKLDANGVIINLHYSDTDVIFMIDNDILFLVLVSLPGHFC